MSDNAPMFETFDSVPPVVRQGRASKWGEVVNQFVETGSPAARLSGKVARQTLINAIKAHELPVKVVQRNMGKDNEETWLLRTDVAA